MEKQTKDKVFQIRLSGDDKLKISFLAKLLKVSKAEAIRQAIQKMLSNGNNYEEKNVK